MVGSGEASLSGLNMATFLCSHVTFPLGVHGEKERERTAVSLLLPLRSLVPLD